MIFSSFFLHAVTFSHVLHLDVLKSQIGLKLKVKTEISLCMAIMQNNPLPSLYTQYYRTVIYIYYIYIQPHKPVVSLARLSCEPDSLTRESGWHAQYHSKECISKQN